MGKELIFSGKKNFFERMKKEFQRKDILVTGGCGSIGSELVAQLLKFNPKRVRVFDNNESGLFNLQQKLDSSLIRILIGDIRDKERLRLAVMGCDIVFHAAALKHVPLCEYNPFEAVNTNVLGTQNLVEVSRDEKVGKFISISTDKAVNPINTMGATKLLAEKIVMTGDIGVGCETKFSCVRFGNVLDSVGSVIPIFRCQIKRGGPVTITSPDMVRFFMSMPQAVNLILKAATLTKGRDTFILKMNKLRIIDLAEVMIKRFSPIYSQDPKKIRIKMIGLRPGEKLDEKLVTNEEEHNVFDLGDFYVLRIPKILPSKVSFSKSKNVSISNQRVELLSKDEIEELLERYSLIK
jgi:UDP-N-acetylglucosamine 4,6-dehydratase/5-epimerase